MLGLFFSEVDILNRSVGGATTYLPTYLLNTALEPSCRTIFPVVIQLLETPTVLLCD
jgi:hypothetical protein